MTKKLSNSNKEFNLLLAGFIKRSAIPPRKKKWWEKLNLFKGGR